MEGFGDAGAGAGDGITTSESVESFLDTLDDLKLTLNPIHKDQDFEHVNRMLYRRCFGELGEVPEAYRKPDSDRFPFGMDVNTLVDFSMESVPGKLSFYFSSCEIWLWFTAAPPCGGLWFLVG